ncbi:MAG: GNAT family N-acetyltransferase [Armatimonadetes bacterium]|nr:GNAT family N-acetyltransferase [Armatimonadota bacterium]
MGSLRVRLEKLRKEPPLGALRLAFRKLVYRKVSIRRYEVTAANSRAPHRPLSLRIAFLDSPGFDSVLETNPYLSSADVERFRQQNSVCIVLWDGDRIIASSWMTNGRIYVSELHRYIHIPPDEHFSCRTYVRDDYRGRSLADHMIHAYSQRVQPSHCIWGLVYGWNVASIRLVEKLGWRHTGDYWTRFIVGRKLPGERRFAPRPPETLDNVD